MYEMNLRATTSGQISDARLEWQRGWPAVCAGAIGSATAQIHFASIGIFLTPMSKDLGWNASTITLGIFICAIFSVPGSPLVGVLAQRVGLNRVILAGMPLFLIAFASLSMFSFDKTHWIIGWTLLACASVLSKGNLWMFWIAQKFDASRGMAFALVTCGAGLFSMFVPILGQLSIETFGWRATFPLLAAGLAVVALPACSVGFRLCPSDKIEPNRERSQLRLQGVLMSEAVRQRSFWQIGLNAFVIGAGLVSLQVHLVPMFQSSGLSPHMAALVAGGFGATALIGRFVAGALLDRFSPNLIGMVSLLLPAFGCLIFWIGPINPITGFAVTLLLGLGVGAEGDVLGYITAKQFGVQNFGAIFGAISGLFALGSGIGPQVMSIMLDQWGSYSLVLLTLFFVLFSSAFIFVTLSTSQSFENGNTILNPIPHGDQQEKSALDRVGLLSE